MIKNILAIGGAGELGSKALSAWAHHNITNIDFKTNPNAKINITLKPQFTPADNNKLVLEHLSKQPPQYHSILVTAGGWAGGNIKNDDYMQKLTLMYQMNLYPSMLAAHLATKYLQPKGLVIFTGSAAVFKEPQPEMIAYALSKTGVHSLAMNLAEHAKQFQGRVITILPETIDTKLNREAMPTADHSKWPKPEQIVQLLTGWVEGLNLPNNGSFVVLGVKNGCITTEFV